VAHVRSPTPAPVTKMNMSLVVRALTVKPPMMTCTAHPMLGMPALPYWKFRAMATMTNRPKYMAMSTMSLDVPVIADTLLVNSPKAISCSIINPPSSSTLWIEASSRPSQRP
jgi:hypothetical protein